jgi:hypothetical protein
VNASVSSVENMRQTGRESVMESVDDDSEPRTLGRYPRGHRTARLAAGSAVQGDS